MTVQAEREAAAPMERVPDTGIYEAPPAPLEQSPVAVPFEQPPASVSFEKAAAPIPIDEAYIPEPAAPVADERMTAEPPGTPVDPERKDY